MFLIVGFTKRTSYSLAKYLSEKKYTLVIADQANTSEQQSLLNELSQQTTIINELGTQDASLLSRYPIKKIFLSPGVPRRIPLIQEALKLGIPVLNDIEYFYQLFPDRKYVAISGTDGKTTVTTWLHYVISGQYDVVLAGNIGIPIFEYADDKYQDCIFLLELSSFQLESIQNFKADIAIITNIHEDHLDRYDNMQEYALTKKRIFLNQTPNDIAIINHEDNYSMSFSKDIQAKKYYFSSINQADVYVDKGSIYLNDTFLLNASELLVIGEHNIQNALIVMVVSYVLNVDQDLVKDRLKSFQGVEHRLEFVDKVAGVDFYNDSKATTLQALTNAVNSFDKPVILLAGGQDKGADYHEITPLIRCKTKKTITFGELSEELTKIWGSDKCLSFPTLKQAVEKAIDLAEDKDIILLSPGAASFDEFTSFEERGCVFKDLVNKYKMNYIENKVK